MEPAEANPEGGGGGRLPFVPELARRPIPLFAASMAAVGGGGGGTTPFESADRRFLGLLSSGAPPSSLGGGGGGGTTPDNRFDTRFGGSLGALFAVESTTDAGGGGGGGGGTTDLGELPAVELESSVGRFPSASPDVVPPPRRAESRRFNILAWI